MDSQSQVQRKLTVSVLAESESGGGNGTASLAKGQCLCSPTTHEGSFRCRLHRSVTASSSPPSWMKRSKSK
ncbi:hypothetical protein LR48_Vigan11g082100 [Vigna angularis]|uniref:Uncharacterized protein n=1 Tax=Phaseolus angularis TaxID=3914 RepID=A0A0L9VS60_PHAAN|nr:hypothetical protein LR48_Vigan11g082100 [Vigna angularis]